jgi:hypothetical protein
MKNAPLAVGDSAVFAPVHWHGSPFADVDMSIPARGAAETVALLPGNPHDGTGEGCVGSGLSLTAEGSVSEAKAGPPLRLNL